MSLQILGRSVPSELHEILVPAETAVVVVDAQNDFCAVGGRAHSRDGDLSALQPAIARLHALLTEARCEGVLIVYVQNTVRGDGRMIPEADLVRRASMWGVENPLITVEGTWGHKIIDELTPAASDFVVPKFRQTGFVGTNLELVLRSNYIKTTVFTGFETHGCVEATARDAMSRDFRVVMAADAMAAIDRSLHASSLKGLSTLLPKGWITTTDAIIGAWHHKATPQSQPPLAEVSNRRQRS